MTEIESEYAKIDWQNLEDEVCRKLNYLRLAWAASERDCPPAMHRKMVEDLYLPAIKLLAGFCCCIDEAETESELQ